MKKAYDYISKESPQNAVKVLEDIVAAVNKAIPNPEFYSAEKFKKIMTEATGLLKNIITESLIGSVVKS